MSFYRPGGIGTGSATTVPYQISEGGTGANNAADARSNLGISATGDDPTYAKKANNLSDLTNVATARTNLGLATVASTGSYNDLSNTPSIPSALDDLVDVVITGAASGQILTYVSGSWVNASSIADGVLTFNGRDGAVTLTSADVNTAVGDTVLVSGDIGVTIQAYDPNILVSGDIGVLVEAYDPNILRSGDIGVKVEAYNPEILVSGDIGVTVQGYDASILKSADIGVKVQAYDPNILVSGDIGVTIQPYDATILNASAIGSTVQAYDSNLTSFVGTFTLPTTDGTANQVLKTDGAGNIGFASAAAAGVSSFNTRTGAVTLTSGDVTTALGYTPLGSADIGVSVQAYDSDTTKNDVANTFTTNQIISTSSSNAALRITQTGAGNALVVEDSTNPDSSPFVVDATGFVIVGYTTNIDGAQIQTFNGSQTNFRWNAAATGPSSYFKKSRSATIGSYSLVSSGDTLGTLRWAGDDGATFIDAATISAAVDGTPGTNDMPGRLVFSTTADGASSPTERFRITSAGAWGLSGANYGTSGQVLTSNGSGSAPTWQTSTTGVSTGKAIAMSIVFGF